jgi:hypothetical protein
MEMLEFPKIREILAGFTSFSASRELACHSSIDAKTICGGTEAYFPQAWLLHWQRS